MWRAGPHPGLKDEDDEGYDGPRAVVAWPLSVAALHDGPRAEGPETVVAWPSSVAALLHEAVVPGLL